MPGKGKRYSEKERDEILAFVDEVNAELRRGGIRSAAEKFDVTPMTISRWRQERLPSGGDSGVTEKLHKMAALHERISVVEAELFELRQEFQNLKSDL